MGRKALSFIFLLYVYATFYSPRELSGLDNAQAGEIEDPVVIAAGNISCGAENSGRACWDESTASLIEKLRPDAVLPLGDLQYEAGQYDNFENYYDRSWGKFKAITRPIPGNHDYSTPEAAGYFDYFDGQNNNKGIAGNRDQGYYSFDIGTWHLIALNSNCAHVGGCSYNSPQGKWLRQDLAEHQNICTLAYWHHPRFSSGQSGNNTSLQTFWTILNRAGTEIVLTGHDHDYERFAPLDLNGEPDPKNGLREFVVGTGGRGLNQFNVIRNYSEARNANSFGVLRLALKQGGYEWHFISSSSFGYTDSGSEKCH